MAGTILPREFTVVFRALVDVLDHHRNRRTGRYHCLAVIIENEAGENLHLVRFAALRNESRLTGATAIKVSLNFSKRKANAWRATIHNAAQGRAVAFAPGGNTEEMAERVVRHGLFLAE